MIAFLKNCQLLVSLGVIGLIWLMYPGAMAIFASAVGFAYVAASLGAIRDNRIAIRAAFVFSVVTAVLAALGVSRFIRNGFDFLTGNFGEHSGIYFLPYGVLAIMIGAMLIVSMQLASWHWLLRDRKS